MLDLENVRFRKFRVSKADGPDYIYIAARLTGSVDPKRTIDTYVYVDIWNADNPSIETLQLRVIEAISKAFSLSPEQQQKAMPAVASTAPVASRSSVRSRGSRAK